ncbi:MAG: alpha/beta fold hydrolase [Desulfuromonadales bacterium]
MMQNLTVIFAHGRESGPWGTKIRALARVAEAHGSRVVSRDDRGTRDPEQRAAAMIAEARLVEGPLVLVGSSMGGYVAAMTAAAVPLAGLFLMAPAIGMPGYASPSPEPRTDRISIVHGWDDEVVPFDKVMAYARDRRAWLHIVPAGHTLVEQLDWLTHLFRIFLQSCEEGHERGTQRQRLLASL